MDKNVNSQRDGSANGRRTNEQPDDDDDSMSETTGILSRDVVVIKYISQSHNIILSQ